MATIFGIGNPLLDITVHVQETVIKEHGLTKGGMHLIDEKKLKEVQQVIALPGERKPAGSCANTLMGLARLGSNAIFVGKVGEDAEGESYAQGMKATGVVPFLSKKGRTGMVISMITPDTERTMMTHLGAALTLSPEDIPLAKIAASDHFHCTGYMTEEVLLKKSLIACLSKAKEKKIPISFDLADAGIVKRNHAFIQEIVRDFATIIFMNEDEAKAFTGREEQEALEAMQTKRIIVLKVGVKGSYIQNKSASGSTVLLAPAFRVNAVDTTGAGDLFAAGFLHAYTQGYPLEKCGKLGSYLASIIVQQRGAFLEKSVQKEAQKILNE
jgi:sugar/nucleoside kinase (ribokinase family)